MKNIAVIIPVYNKSSTIQRAIDSVLNQTCTATRIIIVNDGSTDQTAAVLENSDNEQIEVIHQENQGVSAARNAGIKIALNGDFEYIAFLDADDYWEPNHLSTIIDLNSKFPIATVFATNYLLHEKHGELDTIFSNLEPDTIDSILEPFFKYNYLNSALSCSTVVCHSSCFERAEIFNNAFTHFEDIDWFIRLGIKEKIAFSISKTVHVDLTAQNRSDKVNISSRHYPDFKEYDQIESAYKTEGLKRYLSLNRYAIALDHKIYGDDNKAKTYINLLDKSHLNKKQKSLLKMSGFQLKSLRKTQQVLTRLGWHLRAGS